MMHIKDAYEGGIYMSENKNEVKFCTCKDRECPCHPSNHDKGCTPCIAKNLKQGEIPSCFFYSIDHPKPTEGWYFEDFARLVDAAKKAGKL